MKQTIDNQIWNINPSPIEQREYQKHGLDSDASRPNDYLRLVAKTFSTFRGTTSEDSVITYINGFELFYEKIISTEIVDLYPTDVEYNIFKLNSGSCLIDNQLIEFDEKSMFIYKLDDLKKPIEKDEKVKYAIVIKYLYVNQYDDNNAQITFIPYDDLTFPRENDNNVVTCKYEDTSLNGTLTTSEFSGTPGLIIGTFSIDYKGRVVSSFADPIDIDEDGVSIYNDKEYNIDPQGLDKLYIQNYKLLFEYFGTQARSVLSASDMTQSTFISVGVESIDSTLKSGDMCYFDPVETKYKPALASRQKFDQVTGLYLNEFSSGNHLIYLNGLVTIDQVKHNISTTHPILNLIPGKHYFLEDSCSLWDENHPTVTVGEYILTDNAGRISPRFYNGCVKIGTAQACNQILLNIDHAIEIGAENLLDLFGNYDGYELEVKSQIDYKNAEHGITVKTELIEEHNININKYLENIGDVSNDALSAILTPIKIILFIVEKLNILFKDEYDFENLKSKTIYSDIVDTTNPLLEGITSDNYELIKTEFNNEMFTLNGLKNTIMKIIEIIVNEKNNSVINDIVTSSNTSQYSEYIKNKINIKRFALGDDYENELDNFENYKLNDANATNNPANYTNFINDLELINNEIISNLNIEQSTTLEKYSLNNMYTEIVSKLSEYIYIIDSWKLIYDDMVLELNNINNQLLLDIKQLELDKIEASKKITSLNPTAIDIFYMDENQRKIFNYTYVTDRLKRRMYLVDTIQFDIDQYEIEYRNIMNSDTATAVEKAAADREKIRLANIQLKNNEIIEDLKIEFNNIRIQFGLEPITVWDKDFDPGTLVDERLGSYRFGCDDHTDCYNGLCTNTISPCEGILYDFDIMATQNDVSLGKIIEFELNKGETIDLFRVMDTDVDMTNLNVVLSDPTIGDIIIEEGIPINGIDSKLIRFTANNIASTYNVDLTVNTGAHTNILKLNIKVI